MQIRIIMKILYFSSDNNSGSGAFRVLVREVSELIENGHEVLVVLPYHGSGTKMLKDKNIPYVNIFTFSWIKHLKFNPWDYISHVLFMPVNWITYRRELKLIEKFKPDISVINTCYTYVGAKASYKKNIPVVWHIRELLREDQGKDYFNKKYAYSMLNKAYRVICPSKGVADANRKYIDENKLMYIYEGVNVNYYLNKDKKILQDDTIHFVNAGRIKRAKGQYLIIQALNELKDVKFDLTLVGFVRPGYKKKLLKVCEFKDRINFVGQVKDVRPYYEKSDIFLMPSLFEAFGLVTVEAMLAGLYVIGSDMVGTKEILTSVDEKYPCLFKSEDYQSLKEKILFALEHKEDIKNIIPIYQAKTMDLFNGEKSTLATIEIYKKAAESR